MSATEDPNIPIPAETPPPPAAASSVGDLVNQMRLQVVGVGLAFLILSLAFNFYVFRHNSKLRMQRDAMQQRSQDLQEAEKRFMPVVNDLAGYTVQQPQLRVLFERNGLHLGANTNQPAASPR